MSIDNGFKNALRSNPHAARIRSTFRHKPGCRFVIYKVAYIAFIVEDLKHIISRPSVAPSIRDVFFVQKPRDVGWRRMLVHK